MKQSSVPTDPRFFHLYIFYASVHYAYCKHDRAGVAFTTAIFIMLLQRTFVSLYVGTVDSTIEMRKLSNASESAHCIVYINSGSWKRRLFAKILAKEPRNFPNENGDGTRPQSKLTADLSAG